MLTVQILRDLKTWCKSHPLSEQELSQRFQSRFRQNFLLTGGTSDPPPQTLCSNSTQDSISRRDTSSSLTLPSALPPYSVSLREGIAMLRQLPENEPQATNEEPPSTLQRKWRGMVT